jgi:alanyl-tRNA synthetase
LGDHVVQAGSYVGPDYLRFDFNHFEPVAERHLKQIEKLVNDQIFHNNRVTWQEMPIGEAKQLGAKALFSEKYGEQVRVVMTNDSIELCGGCHVRNTIEIGMFKIQAESGIGAGIRRIEAFTSIEAFQYLQSHHNQIDFLSQVLKTNRDEVRQKVQYLMLDYKQSVREIEALQQQVANATLQDLYKEAISLNNTQLLTVKVYNIEAQPLRNMIDQFKEKLGSAFIVIANIADDKVAFMVGATKDLIERGAHSGKLIKEIATICGGNGGGRPDFAQAGAKEINQIEHAFNYVTEYIKSL